MRRLALSLPLLAAPVALAAQDAAAPPRTTGTLEAYVALGNGSDLAPIAIGAVTHRRVRGEARYGYEDEDTGAVFGGWELARDGRASLWIAPMLGVVFGRTNGVAPAVELELESGRFDLYVESEYLFAAEDDASFLFTWSTATWRLTDRVSAGLVAQRLRPFHQAPGVDRGAVAMLAMGRGSVALYVYNPFGKGAFAQAGVGYEF